MLITTCAAPFASSAGTPETFFGAGGSIGDYEFKAALTIDQPDAMPNGFGQECHPVDGTLVISTPNGTSGTFMLDIQG
jgi:hypothetical protein